MIESYRVRHGGLMRCCLQTLADAMVASEHPPKDGDTLACAYEKDQPTPRMRFRDGAWEWNGE